MQHPCPKFEPNLWKPHMCSNCFQLHASPSLTIPRTLSSVEPRKRTHAAHRAQKQLRHQPAHTQPSTNHISHSRDEGVKRKKGGPSGSSACESFSPQRWRPAICMHCFEPITLHPNDPFMRGDYNNIQLSDVYMNLVHMDISSPLQDDGNGGDDSTTPATSTSTPTPTTKSRNGVTPPIDKMDDTLSKFSSLSFATKSEEDNDDPFRDFEELDDSSLSSLSLSSTASSSSSSARFEIKTTTTFTSYTQGFDIATTLDSVRDVSTSPRKREQFFNKYKDEDDWDGGVDMDVESFVAMAEYSYVNNKIMEIASVKQEAERSQAAFPDNPTVVTALFEILTAKQQQIQKALAREKINAQDHSKLIERLNAVKDMLKPNQSATW